MIDSLQYIADSNTLIEATSQHLFDSIVQSHSFPGPSIQEAGSSTATIVSIIVVIVIFGSFFGYNLFNNRYWERGIFPPILLDREINHFEAIVCLSANIMRCNKEGYLEKRGVLIKYMQRHYPELYLGVNDSLLTAFSNPISTDSIAYWLNKHLSILSEKLRILDLLFAIATIDGHVLKNECRIIEQFCSLMGIPNQEYTQRWEAYNKVRLEHEKKERSKVKTTKESDGLSLKNTCLSLFDLSIDSSKETIKKSYRKLVKANHPDMFKDATLDEKQVISERFIEIQEAYEYLMNLP